MEKIINRYFWEVWFSDGKTYLSEDLHDVFNMIRFCRPVNGSLNCLVMFRCDYINSCVVPVLSRHELVL